MPNTTASGSGAFTMSAIIDNLQRAIETIEQTEDSKLDLSTFKRLSFCGTLHCTAGWLASDPYFQQQGMCLIPYDPFYNPHHWILGYKGKSTDWEWDWLDPMFGPNAFDELFTEYGRGALDQEIIGADHPSFMLDDNNNLYWSEEEDVPKPMTDKTLALARLRLKLSTYTAATAE